MQAEGFKELSHASKRVLSLVVSAGYHEPHRPYATSRGGAIRKEDPTSVTRVPAIFTCLKLYLLSVYTCHDATAIARCRRCGESRSITKTRGACTVTYVPVDQASGSIRPLCLQRALQRPVGRDEPVPVCVAFPALLMLLRPMGKEGSWSGPPPAKDRASEAWGSVILVGPDL